MDAIGETVESAVQLPADPLIGTVFDGKYVIDALIGVGGMGKVYRGRNLRTEHSIAIKTLMPELVHDESLVRRFEVEAKAASNLSHPNTIRVYDHGNEGKLLWMVMELLDGISLERALNIERAIEPRRLIGLMRQVCASLAEAHGKGLIHRDLKPDNIFLNRAGGEADFVKVLDFGVAKLKDPKFGSEKLTQAGMIFGTPRYMSPEQARAKELDERSDIYALGVIMFECLTGKAPFEAADPIGVLVKHCNEPVPTFASVNPSLVIDPVFEEIVRRCLAKKPEQRPATVKVLRAELDALDIRLASGQPAPDNATRHLDLGASPEETQGDQKAPDTFDRLGITQQSGRQPANPSILMNSESHRAAHDKAPLGLIMMGALAVLVAGATALVFFSKNDETVVAPAPAPAAVVAPPVVAPLALPPPAALAAPSGSGSGSGSGGTPEAALSGAPPAAPAAPAAKPEESKAPTNATTPAPKRVVDSKPGKKTVPAKPGPNSGVEKDPYD